MKIYEHRYSLGGRKIKTFEHEAEEKTKIYVIGRRRVAKDSIGKLRGEYFKDVWTFSSDTTEFVNALIKNNAERIEKAKKELERFEEAKIAVKEETVRKMQERLKARNKVYCNNKSDLKEMNFVIDQIAKEMLEETECKNKGEEICKNTHQKK